MRPLFDGTGVEYTGLDIEAGPNVDIVMNDAYNWDNVPNESFDFVISANAFEHIEYPWLTIKLIYDKLKQGGIACIHAPSPFSFDEHRYPFDCYRYFSDGFRALGKWAGFQIINTTVAGVPSMSASIDWDTNDAMMIAIKSDKPVNSDDYPVLAYERRVKFYSQNYMWLSFKIWISHAMPRTYLALRKIKRIFLAKKFSD